MSAARSDADDEAALLAELERLSGPAPEPSEPPEPERPTEPRLHDAPPLFGGTLFVTHDGLHAVASDPERDRIFIAALDPLEVAHEISLSASDEPGPAAETSDGRVHVILRRGGAVVSFDPSAPALARRDVCPAPRGIAARGDEVSVACAGGELVTLSSDHTQRTVRRIAPDLRDVGYEADGTVWVSQLRSAHVIHVRGETLDELEIPTENRDVPNSGPTPYRAGVAWRTVPLPGGGQLMLHQRERKAQLPLVLEYYGDRGAAMFGALTWIEDGAVTASAWIPPLEAVLPIDGAPLADGRVAIAFGGDGGIDIYDPESGRMRRGPLAEHPGRAVGLVALGEGLLVQYQDPPALARFERPDEVGGTYAALGPAILPDRGQQLFHSATPEGVACASCHPEGLDDGHVWIIPGHGPRRTQPLTGGVLRTAPFHWSGDLQTFDSLMAFVFTGRMGGGQMAPEDLTAIARWIDGLPDPDAPSVDHAESIARGRALFADQRVGCLRCHSGSRGTDGLSHDVGTGGTFQTPPLVGLAQRAPYLHDGCAATIEERFGRCHTPGHGRIDQLSPDQIEDLVRYLGSR
ncbi:MAG: cytochrome-c peroxidase [Sandaracinaceae bacterium]